MYQYFEIHSESRFVTKEGDFLAMSVDDSERKWPVCGIVKQIEALDDERLIIQLRIQPQFGSDFVPLSLVHAGTSLTLSKGIHIPTKGELGKALVNRHWFEPATRTSWQNTPIPDANKTVLLYERVFTQKEFDRVKLGEIPVAMEDHWFAYFENNCLYWFRSWTGKGVFELYLEPQTKGAKVIKAIGNNDSAFDAGLTSVERLSGLMGGLTWHGEQIFDI